MTLEELIRRAGVWRGGELPLIAAHATGFETLDAALPGGGWPRSGLVEILSAACGVGALRLVLPALAGLSRSGRWIIWVEPPHVPYAPALEARGVDLDRVLIVELPRPGRAPGGEAGDDVLWAFEQALRFADCGAALAWLEDDVPSLELRRLQLAAEAGASTGIVFRPARCAAQPSPAMLRLMLDAVGTAADGTHRLPVELTLIKGRGLCPGTRYRLEI